MDCALYIHIPFCVKKCAYCDFASYAGRNRDIARYLHALAAEMAAAARAWGPLRATSVYLGGGTPTLLSGAQAAALLAMLRDHFALAPEAEITMEGNPGTLRPADLCAYRRAGVNRLSLGVQALSDPLLAMLGRAHSAAQARQAVTLARAAGFDNLNLDLIYALPGQDEMAWLDTLAAALELGPQHLSLYSLIVEEGTPLSARVRAGECALPAEEAVLAMQHEAARRLREAGYARYEISNYALPGRECRHNMVYWTRGDYLGLGCAAHSLMREQRFANAESLDDYLAAPAAMRPRAAIGAREALEEAVMLLLRTEQGIALDAFARRYDFDLRKERADTLARLVRHGLARLENGRFRLTERGMDVHNAVVLALIAPPGAS